VAIGQLGLNYNIDFIHRAREVDEQRAQERGNELVGGVADLYAERSDRRTQEQKEPE
jgi:hypothetical protein